MDLVRVDKKGLTIERADEKIFEKNAMEFHQFHQVEVREKAPKRRQPKKQQQLQAKATMLFLQSQ